MFSLGLLVWLAVSKNIVAPWWLWILWGLSFICNICKTIYDANNMNEIRNNKVERMQK